MAPYGYVYTANNRDKVGNFKVRPVVPEKNIHGKICYLVILEESAHLNLKEGQKIEYGDRKPRDYVVFARFKGLAEETSSSNVVKSDFQEATSKELTSIEKALSEINETGLSALIVYESSNKQWSFNFRKH